MSTSILEMAERLKPGLRRLHLCKLAYMVLRGFVSAKVSTQSLQEAEAELMQIHSGSDESCVCENEVEEKPRYDLTVVVPAYNVEKYIRKCLDSILSQKTQYSFCVMVTDDGSTDSTPGILDEYSDCVTVITQENKGLSAARNVALRHICSRYIMFVDSDDYLTPGTVEALLKTACEEDADIVDCRYSRVTEEGVLTGQEDSTEGFAWGKVIRSELFRRLRFPEGYWHEDGLMQTLVKPMAKKVCVIDHVGYMYTCNPNGITAREAQSPRVLDMYWMCKTEAEDRIMLGIADTQQFYEECLDDVIYILSQAWGLSQSDAYAVAMMHQLNGERMKHYTAVTWRHRQMEKEVRAGRTERAKLAAILL